MSYRETPRIAAQEGQLDGVVEDENPRARLRRFDFVRAERQLDIPRVVAAAALVLAAVTLGGYLGLEAVRRMVAWLHQQPQYQIRFDQIHLQEEPPGWFLGGTQAFLRQVRERAKEPETLSVMQLESERIERDFRLFPWVDDVRRVEYPPSGITVHLVYKQPVALIPFPPIQPVFLDREATILPAQDVDRSKLGPLILIADKSFDQGSPENQPGHAWKSSAPGEEGPKLERCVKAAAKLAGFLQERNQAIGAEETPALRVLAIFATDPNRGLFIQTSEMAIVQWGEAPGSETATNLKASEKWDILRKWAITTSRRVLPGRDYWAFSRGDLRPVKTTPSH